MILQVCGELRDKKRYILCRVRTTSDSLTAASLHTAIMNKLCEFYGWSGRAISALKTWQLKDKRDYFILRCSLKGLPYVLFSTSLVTYINHEKVAIDVLRISGTIKSLLS